MGKKGRGRAKNRLEWQSRGGADNRWRMRERVGEEKGIERRMRPE